MTDYARLQRHLLYRSWAEWIGAISIVLIVPEVWGAIIYHFPLWDDIALPVTGFLRLVCSFVMRKTKMYEVGL